MAACPPLAQMRAELLVASGGSNQGEWGDPSRKSDAAVRAEYQRLSGCRDSIIDNGDNGDNGGEFDIMRWIKKNPLLALGAGVLILLIVKK